jgi:hypothetical protein
MKLFHLRWIPNQLTEKLRASRIQNCQELLPLLERMEANKFRNILTGDESWLLFESQQAVKWSPSREDVSDRVRQQIGTKEFMLTVVWKVEIDGCESFSSSENSIYSSITTSPG